MLGITKVEKKKGEYWVYVPRGSRKMTIKHNSLGVLRNYLFPETIQSAMVYEMELTTRDNSVGSGQEQVATQWLIIKSEPTHAQVFINDKLAGETPFQRKYREGNYVYRLEKARYHNLAGTIGTFFT